LNQEHQEFFNLQVIKLIRLEDNKKKIASFYVTEMMEEDRNYQGIMTKGQ